MQFLVYFFESSPIFIISQKCILLSIFIIKQMFAIHIYSFLIVLFNLNHKFCRELELYDYDRHLILDLL